MHFIQNLLNYMAPPLLFLFGDNQNLPDTFARVVTKNGSFVVTSRNKDVIARKYV